MIRRNQSNANNEPAVESAPVGSTTVNQAEPEATELDLPDPVDEGKDEDNDPV